MIAVLTALYACVGVAAFIGYFPQIWSLWKDDTRAASTSLTTWGWWSATGIISVAYAVFVNKDPALILVASSNLCCFVVFILAAYRRYYGRRIK